MDLSPENVTDRQSFIELCKLLKLDLDNNNGTWENNTLGNFLRAVAAYTEDIQGFYDNFNHGINADIPSWRTFATILTGASVYE